MVNWGPFVNVVNTGKSDSLILASELLHQNLDSIKANLTAKGMEPVPTIGDIQETHVMYTVSEFKPHVAVSHEYLKETTAGSYNLNSDVKIAISQFGDFFHDMVLHIEVGYEGSDSTYIKNLSGPAGTNDWRGSGAQPRYKFCNHPGERIVKKCSFVVNGNTLDEYDSTDVTFWREFNLDDEGKREWNKLVGQEVPFKGIRQHSLIDDINGNNFYKPVIGGTPGSDIENSFVQSAVDNYAMLNDVSNYSTKYMGNKELSSREVVQICNGYQTPKFQHGKLDLWIPLLFWFNKDVRLSIPSIAIPYGNRSIEFTLCSEQELVGVVPSDISLNTAYKGYTETGGKYGTLNNPFAVAHNDSKYGQNIDDVYNILAWDKTNLDAAVKDVTTNPLKVNKIELYVNNLFVDSAVHDIFISRVGFNLIRVYRRQSFTVDNQEQNLHLNQMKWPIETMYVGIRMSEYERAEMPYLDIWNTFGWWPNYRLNRQVQSKPAIDSGAVFNGDVSFTAVDGSAVADRLPSYVSGERTVTYREYRPTVNKLTLCSHSICLMQDVPYAFYSRYVPWKHRSPTSSCQQECRGAAMISFALYPGAYQPSGHINVSRATEFYIKYHSNVIGNASSWFPEVVGGNVDKPQGRLYVSAVAINFLLISDGSAVLRFST